jgi:DNA primase
MNSPVQEIKERLSIVDVVSSYIKLENAGANLKARCPFHNEKTPSFFISPDRGTYYCFGCSAKGDIFTFVEEFEGLDFKGALKLLADKAGVKLTFQNQEGESEKERLYKIMEEATNYFSDNLSKNKESLDYLKSRGISENTIKDFRIGFAKLEWRGVHPYLKAKGFSDLEIEKAGLVKKAEKASPTGATGFYDRFRGRVMFPIADSSGRIIAFSGRILVDDGKSAKYLNSPDTPIFSKSYVLYGLDRAKESIRKNNFSILVEGQMDLILSHQSGFKNTIASSGTALSDATVTTENIVSNLGLVRRLSENMVIAFDADRAGFEASSRAAKIALSLDMDVKVARMNEGVDPADLIAKEGVEAWREAIRNSKHIIEFVLERVLKNYKDNTRKAGREIKEKVLPFVDSLSSSIEKMHFLKKISDMSGISEVALKEDLEKVKQDPKYEQDRKEDTKSLESKMFRRDYIERRLLGIIFWQEIQKQFDTSSILKELSEILGLDPEQILKQEKYSKDDLVFEAEVFYGKDADLEKDARELIGNLKEEYLKTELFHLMQELNLAENNKDNVKSVEVLKKINELNNKIQNIKSGRLTK